jgi:hypothetical protein
MSVIIAGGFLRRGGIMCSDKRQEMKKNERTQINTYSWNFDARRMLAFTLVV